jgi:hypothetical protein
MENSNDTIGNRTHDLPACSVVPEPTAPPRAHNTFNELFNRLCNSVATNEKLDTDILKWFCGGGLFHIFKSVREKDFHKCWSITVGRQVVPPESEFLYKEITLSLLLKRLLSEGLLAVKQRENKIKKD